VKNRIPPWAVVILAPTIFVATLFFFGSETSEELSAGDLAVQNSDANAQVTAGQTTSPSTVPTPMPNPTATDVPTATPVPVPTKVPTPLGGTDCATGEVDAPTGELTLIQATTEVIGSGAIKTFTVEIEAGLAIDHDCFVDEFERILFDERSWVGSGEVAWQQVAADGDFRIILASPSTTDKLCLPWNTLGIYSCAVEQLRSVWNVERWRNGASDFDSIEEYRIYLVNHEIGHILRHEHVACLNAGAAAPVMMQQTKSTGACVANGWPLADGTEG